ncbi:isochorismatase family protein [Paraburkholderia silvatlantica]|uniref:Nicotinamidase-related amidase n=1 Tax=Paraburkholderia silvatlantica TaxID=321895 RepID=A0ABR6FKY9_9BURK|nr:isochorismatase family protein [Paraburkholderia silvatlantica]MBB2928053.1 nicotinamidase-related amidase [Paraburkholderia silvatlantica]PVY31019.1 nicotinamidase-related amidase [Paraburkholderia silvatlantica]PXW37155.1 nicotinamidase-related amidase [Paraburkholderia silvatlantica]
MNATRLDLKTALIVIDLQKIVASIPAAHPFTNVLENACHLAANFRQHGLPVVLVNVVGTAPGRTEQHHAGGALPPDWSELLPELNQQPQDHLVSKKTWGAFTGTGLEAHLKSAGVTQVVICGVATSVGVESTARQAHELGFNVTLAVDAMTDISAQAHANSLERIFPKLGETGTTREIVNLLSKRST